MTEKIMITQENYAEFVNEYEKAKYEGKESFFFYGQETLVSFAKYLLQYYQLQKDFKKKYR